jgi:hypothetical protein
MALQGDRCARLLRSDLPSIQGNLVLNNSLALRLIIRMSAMRQSRSYDQKQYAAAEHACACLVKCPLFDPLNPVDTSSSKSFGSLMDVQMAHCFRFSIEYLLQLNLVRVTGKRVKNKPEEKEHTESDCAQETVTPVTPLSWDAMDESHHESRLNMHMQKPGEEFMEFDSDIEVEDEVAQSPLVQSSGGQPQKRKSRLGQLEPNDLAAFVAHLFFMEPANFAFLSLLMADDGQAFIRLCKPSEQKSASQVQDDVLAVLCNIFCRTRLPRTVADQARLFPASKGISTVVLKSLDEIGEPIPGSDGQMICEGRHLKAILRKHNETAVSALAGYWGCFVKAYAEQLGHDDTLPVSGCRFKTFPIPSSM